MWSPFNRQTMGQQTVADLVVATQSVTASGTLWAPISSTLWLGPLLLVPYKLLGLVLTPAWFEITALRYDRDNFKLVEMKLQRYCCMRSSPGSYRCLNQRTLTPQKFNWLASCSLYFPLIWLAISDREMKMKWRWSSIYAKYYGTGLQSCAGQDEDYDMLGTIYTRTIWVARYFPEVYRHNGSLQVCSDCRSDAQYHPDWATPGW